MRQFLALSISFLAVLMMWSKDVSAQTGRNVAKYNLTSAGVGLGGFDPVAVFAEGGAKAAQGKTEFEVEHSGVTYLFASEQNMKTFIANPAKYEPTYGGWCAYAMAQDSRVEINPAIFTINGNRAHYFVNNRAKRSFDAKLSDFETRADANWKRFSGEEPRL
jgi:YHS domain-containing protein